MPTLPQTTLYIIQYLYVVYQPSLSLLIFQTYKVTYNYKVLSIYEVRCLLDTPRKQSYQNLQTPLHRLSPNSHKRDLALPVPHSGRTETF